MSSYLLLLWGSAKTNHFHLQTTEEQCKYFGFASSFFKTKVNQIGIGERASINASLVELQRMFEHSNIIRLRFSRTTFFYERTFVVARGLFLAHALRSEASAAASHKWRYSCVDACQCHVPEISRERSGNMNFQLEEKHERQSF